MASKEDLKRSGAWDEALDRPRDVRSAVDSDPFIMLPDNTRMIHAVEKDIYEKFADLTQKHLELSIKYSELAEKYADLKLKG